MSQLNNTGRRGSSDSLSFHLPRLCVSVLPKHTEELLGLLQHCRELDVNNDIIELRLDALPVKEAEHLDWSAIRSAAPVKHLLVTYRLPSEGGFFTGEPPERARLYQAALQAGVEYIDVEYAAWYQMQSLLNIPEQATVVLSKHFFSPHDADAGLSVEQLEHELEVMFACEDRRYVYKVIFTANSIDAALTAEHGRVLAGRYGKQVIIHAMGTEGELSRIFGALPSFYLPDSGRARQLGIPEKVVVPANVWTYCALEAACSTAPGQLTLHEALHVYRLPEKIAHVRLFGLLGYPTAQSKGKYLHNALYKEYGHSAECLYVHCPTPDAERFWERWCDVLSGFSITIPHKEACARLLAVDGVVSEEVRRSGVCNTAVRTPEGWRGYNTDALALYDCLLPYKECCAKGTLVIGTGATTQSVLAVLQMMDVHAIVVVGRNQKRGHELAAKYDCTFLAEEEFSAMYNKQTHKKKTLSNQGKGFWMVIQTTPVGMMPNGDSVPLGKDVWKHLFDDVFDIMSDDKTVAKPVVMDVVYNPLRTALLQIAEQAGCTTISGDEMFLRQAAHQFRLFTGTEADLSVVRRVWRSIVEESA
jgi:3-dehydroquinate dehydratase/shikimate dehydrogenase